MTKDLERHTRLVRMQIDIMDCLERAEGNIKEIEKALSMLLAYALELNA